MRTIKFRGKNLHNGKWVCGYLSDVDNTPIGKVGIINSKPFSGCEESTMVIAESIGQFTGLHDKNGKEIYECDVLKNNLSDNPFGVVTWHNDGYFFIDCGFGKFPINANGYNPLGKMLVLKIDNVKDVFFEVIGNIHDNPELMEGGAQ